MKSFTSYDSVTFAVRTAYARSFKQRSPDSANSWKKYISFPLNLQLEPNLGRLNVKLKTHETLIWKSDTS